MIKKITLIIISFSFYACAINPQTIDPSINPAEQHLWLPADGEAIENTISQLVDQYARSVVCKLNEDLIGQLEDLSALLSDSDTSEFSAKDDDKY